MGKTTRSDARDRARELLLEVERCVADGTLDADICEALASLCRRVGPESSTAKLRKLQRAVDELALDSVEARLARVRVDPDRPG